MRLIDADKLIENFQWCKEQAGRYNTDQWNDVIQRVNDQLTVEAVPVVHGKWLADSITSSAKCSVCGNVVGLYVASNYCPNCGARMDGKTDYLTVR